MGVCGGVGDVGVCIVLEVRVGDWGRKDDLIGQ
jgi:hypothetical protein